MAQILDISSFDFHQEEITAISQLMYDDFIAAPEISRTMTVFPNIVINKEVGWIGEGGLVGKAGSGCGTPAQDWGIGSRRILWEPKPWKVYLEQCYADLMGKFTVYSLKTGVRISDFASSDYQAIVNSVMGEALRRFAFRYGWFTDTTAANVSSGGFITNGLDVAYFTLVDGLWKQLFTQVTTNAAQRVTITENAGATYAAQEIDIDNILGYLQKLVFTAPNVLRAQSDAVILCTQRFYDAYVRWGQTQAIESTYANVLNGASLSFAGIPIVPVVMWDEMINSYENDGTKLRNPNRALYTTTKILGLGVDAEDSFSNFEVWYDRDTELVKMRAAGQGDVKILRPDMFMLAI